MHICSLLSATQRQLIRFYSCKAVSLFLFQLPAHKEGQALPYPSLAPTAASVGGRGKPQLPLEKKHWKLPELKLCFLSLATNYLCTAKSHTYHYRNLVFHKGKKGDFKRCIRTTSRCEFDSFGYVYRNSSNKKDKKINVLIFSCF